MAGATRSSMAGSGSGRTRDPSPVVLAGTTRAAAAEDDRPTLWPRLPQPRRLARHAVWDLAAAWILLPHDFADRFRAAYQPAPAIATRPADGR